MDKRTQALMAYLDSAHSVYHAANGIAKALHEAGYTQLSEADVWQLQPGGKYYFLRGGSAVMAFRIPETAPRGFLMTASHCDRPTFKIKENSELVGAYTRIAVERFGGMLIAPWLDRPLSVAGRVLVETEDGIESRLIDIDRNLLLIPNVAIHMNRQANEGYKWNPAVDTLPLFGSKEAKGKFDAIIEEAAGGKVLGHDLFLYVRQNACLWGAEEEYISSAALDDLQCAWGCTQGFLNAAPSESIPVLCVFDSEEVGSGSVQGAASDLLETLLGRICRGMGLDLPQMLSQSFMISADNAHALHPNHPELSDANNAPLPGKGIVIKHNAALRYTTDGVSAALMRKVCQKAGVPCQTFYNRADLPGGSTLGHISLSHVSVPSVDIGLAQLAMHSAYETASVADSLYLEEAVAAYYSSTLSHPADGVYTLL